MLPLRRRRPPPLMSFSPAGWRSVCSFFQVKLPRRTVTVDSALLVGKRAALAAALQAQSVAHDRRPCLFRQAHGMTLAIRRTVGRSGKPTGVIFGNGLHRSRFLTSPSLRPAHSMLQWSHHTTCHSLLYYQVALNDSLAINVQDQ